MSSSGHPGEFTRNIRVQTNDPNRASLNLTCKGKALVAFQTDPTMANFGKIERDSGPVTKTITLTRGDGGPLKPTLVTPKESNLSAELRELEAGEKYALDITVNPPWPNDKLRGSVVIETGLEEAPQETVRIFGQLEPRLRSEPKTFVLPETSASEADLRAMLVWSGTPGKALNATPNDPSLSAQVTEENGQQVVVLHVPAGYERKQQKVAQAVTIITDDPVASSLRIPISASAAAAAGSEKAVARPAMLGPRPAKVPAAAVPSTQPEH